MIAQEMWNTHKWKRGVELTWCTRCGRSPIGLGFYGDDNWRRSHRDYRKPCAGEGHYEERPKESDPCNS